MFLKKNKTTLLFILSLTLIVPLFYAFDFTLRVIPSVLAAPLTHTFNLSQSGLGFHASLFLWGYAFFQIPAGMLIDRFGSKRNLVASCFTCSVATIAYAFSPTLLCLQLSRIIIGASAAFAYIGTLKATASFLEERHFATYAAYVQVFGCLGAILGGGPFATLVKHISWRPATGVLGLIGIGITLAIQLCLPQKHKQQHARIQTPQPTNPASSSRYRVLTKQLMATSAFSFCIWAPVSTFAGLWGIPFLEQFYQINTLAAANCVAAMWAGITLGGPLLGMWSSYQSKRLPPMRASAVLATLCSTTIIFIHLPSLLLVSALLFILGMSSSAQAITFGVVIDSQHPSTLGTASSIANTATIAAGIILQPFAGHILDTHHRLIHHAQNVTADYQMALLSIPLILIVSIVFSFFLIKETHCTNEATLPPQL